MFNVDEILRDKEELFTISIEPYILHLNKMEAKRQTLFIEAY